VERSFASGCRRIHTKNQYNKNEQNTPCITKELISLCRKKKAAYKKAIESGKDREEKLKKRN
jgi:hypothetical protein